MITLCESNPVFLGSYWALESNVHGSVKKNVVGDRKIRLLFIEVSDLGVNCAFAKFAEWHRCRV
jgi:hypothetical protein